MSKNNSYYEVNFDGIVGPTHNYSGLSYGNLASMAHKKKSSNPKAAALQGLKKMKLLHDLGVRQAVLPPHERPHLPTLRTLGFDGDDRQVVAACSREAPELLYQLSSAAAMWAANIATMTPSCDSIDGLVHLTPANMMTKLHRAIEPPFTDELLQRLFSAPESFCCHHPLLATAAFADEGAANHMRLARDHSSPGVHLFVYGSKSFAVNNMLPKVYPARHTLEASQAVARRHRLPDERTLFIQQSPYAIDSGVFHNDLIAVGNGPFLLCHEDAFVDGEIVLAELRDKLLRYSNTELSLWKIPSSRLSIDEAVKSYLFNSQIVTLPDGNMAFIGAREAFDNPKSRSIIDDLIADNSSPITAAFSVELHESMHNGGGPACLRLRLVLSEKEILASHGAVYFDDSLYHQLTGWVERYYRDRLAPEDLKDPALLIESQLALDVLTAILELGSLYSFQKR